MTDLSQNPPVPPEDTGGDERIGYALAGLLLMLFGIGVCIIGNLVVHAFAGTSGVTIGPWHVGTTFGSYAYAALALGVLTGGFGAGLIALALRTPSGPFVLPGGTY